MMLFCWIAWAKFGCWMLQPWASTREVITRRSCTPPSGVPSGFLIKRASRIGPFAVMKDGTVLVLEPPLAAIAGNGLIAGLLPPMLGCEWHAAQLSALKRGPRPEPGAPFTVPDTESISWKIACADVKNCFCNVVSPDSEPPAPGAPPRTPGSETAWPKAAPGTASRVMMIAVNAVRLLKRRLFISRPPRFFLPPGTFLRANATIGRP